VKYSVPWERGRRPRREAGERKGGKGQRRRERRKEGVMGRD